MATAVVGLGVGLAACSGTTSNESTTTTAEPPIESTTTTEVPVSAGRQVSFYVPAVGDCYDVRPVDKAPPVHLVLDCSLPHQRQVFATFDWTATKEYPGQDALEAQAKLECPKSWLAFVGAPYETSRFELGFELPDQASWGNGVRHVVGCLIVDPKGGLITGSAQGVAQ
ncbi:MAG: septum formation family protein [Acidimicrobiales bacterium]